RMFDPMANNEIHLHFPEALVPQVISEGFLNSHQTNTTGGTNNFSRRVYLEDNTSGFYVAGATNSAGSNSYKRIRPKSALLQLSGGSFSRDFMVMPQQYGRIVAVPDDCVRKRATWSDGDSYAKTGRAPDCKSFLSKQWLYAAPSDYFEVQIWGE